MTDLLLLWWSVFRYSDWNSKDCVCSWCSLHTYTKSSVHHCTTFLSTLRHPSPPPQPLQESFCFSKYLFFQTYCLHTSRLKLILVFTGHSLIFCRCYFIISLSFLYVFLLSILVSSFSILKLNKKMYIYSLISLMNKDVECVFARMNVIILQKYNHTSITKKNT